MKKQILVNFIVPEGTELEHLLAMLTTGARNYLIPTSPHGNGDYHRCKIEMVRPVTKEETPTILVQDTEKYDFPENS